MKCRALTKEYSTDIKALLRQSGVAVTREKPLRHAGRLTNVFTWSLHTVFLLCNYSGVINILF